MFKKFIKDRNGNFAIMFSFVAVPLLLGVGLAVDYTNVLRIKKQLQAAADSAVLAVAQMGDTISDAQADVLADRFLGGNFDMNYSNLTVNRSGDTVNVAVETRTDLMFGGLIGMNNMKLTATSGAEIANASYEIALALDTTGSMAGGKLQAMKDAVNQLVDNLAIQNPTPGTLKFSVVPFSSMVNVGPENGPAYSGTTVTRYPAAWLDDLGRSPVEQNDLDPGVSRFALYKHLNMVWPGCVETRSVQGGVDFGTNDATPDASKPETLFVPAFAGDDRDNEAGANNYLADNGAPIAANTPVDRMTRYGASYPVSFKSRTFSQQIADSAAWINRGPDYSQQTYYGNYTVNKGPDFSCDVQPLLPLSSNFNAIKNKVNSLFAQGSTNITEGAMWGWRTLSHRMPFSEGAPDNRVGVRKILVLLTDGTNSLGTVPNTIGSSYSSFGYLADGRLGISSGTDVEVTEAMNAKTLAACTNAKADGIEIYTIRLEEPHVLTGNLLRDCATDIDHYLDVPNRAMLDDAFASLIKKIVQVRLSS